MRDGFVQAGAIYLGWTRERYVRAARGDGTWKPLAASTIRGRRKGRGKGKPEILRDTGVLLNSLSLGAPGSIRREIPDGIEVGTVVKYATHHQNPKVPGRPPQRKILEYPPPAVLERMRDVVRRAAIKTVQQLKGK